MNNLVCASRLLRRAPGLSLLIILILAIGIGATTSVFTLINATLLRPLPYRDPSTLVSVSAVDRSDAAVNGCLSYPHFQFLAEHGRVFSGIAAFTNEAFSVSIRGELIEAQAARVSWKFFDLLGVKPAIGRTFMEEEGRAGARSVVLVSNRFWRRRLNGSPNVVGESIALDSRSHTVIGVLPDSLRFGLLGTDVDVWIPRIDELNLASAQQIQGGTCYLDAIARLSPGASIEQARAAMAVLDRQYVHDFPNLGDADPKRPVEVTPLRSKLVANYRSVFAMLSAAVVLVVFIACANAAGLLLMRGLKRRREVAIRIALGAEAGQMVRQFLTESVTLALLGGIAGVSLSFAAIHVISLMPGQSLVRIAELPRGVDLGMFAFALLLSIMTGILCGLAPALQSSKTNVSASLREEGRGTAGARTRNRLRSILVTGQIAISLILLVGAGLLIRSSIALETQSPGFNPHGVLTMNLALPPAKYSKPEQMNGFFDQVLRRLEVLQGVKAAAVSSALPMNIARLTPILVEGQPEVPVPERPIIIIQAFTSGYQHVMQVPLLKGRFFNEFDRADTLPVVIINESFASKFFPNQNAIGKHVWVGRRKSPAQIVGVIGNIKNVSLSLAPQPELDLPFAQLPWGNMNLILRTAGDPKNLITPVRLQIARLDSDLPPTNVQTLDELLAEASSRPRMLMLLLAGFAGFAFVLAIVGLYGAISYSVAQRTQEMGVRVALGATRADVLRLVLGQGAFITSVGIGIGVLCSLLLTGAMEKLVYGISTADPLTFCAVSALFMAAALIASYVPARRAMRVDVLHALRQ